MKCLVFLLLMSEMGRICWSQGHGHSHHGHDHYHGEASRENLKHAHVEGEPASFRYSQAANEKYQTEHDHEHHSHGHNGHDHAHHDHEHHDIHEEHVHIKKPVKKFDAEEIWLYAMGSTLLVSTAPFLILFLIPIDNSAQKQPLLKILLAFASGGLLGDAFLHLIPHAASSVGQDGHGHHEHHPHSHGAGGDHVHDMSVGLGVLGGIVTFLIVEKVVRICKGGGHTHSHAAPKKDSKKSDSEGEKDQKAKGGKKKTVPVEPKKDIKVAGYLNLAADFSHNFTDGLAIGASYLAGNSIGFVTTITILLHEVPHEIGDFAILLQSGISRRNAMLLQLTTALGALTGTAMSLLAKDGVGFLGGNWILPFTAGGFIYIALVSVIPELLQEEKPGLFQTILQVSAMLVGVYFMVLIAEYE